MYNGGEFYTVHNIGGFLIDFYGVENDKLTYCFYTDCDDKMHTATLQLASWAKHLHGNAPGGTLYGWYRILLPNGKRARYNVYL